MERRPRQPCPRVAPPQDTGTKRSDPSLAPAMPRAATVGAGRSASLGSCGGPPVRLQGSNGAETGRSTRCRGQSPQSAAGAHSVPGGQAEVLLLMHGRDGKVLASLGPSALESQAGDSWKGFGDPALAPPPSQLLQLREAKNTLRSKNDFSV